MAIKNSDLRHNPYAAPQVPLSAAAVHNSCAATPRFQMHYVLSSLQTTFSIILILVVTLFGLGLVMGFFQHQWRTPLQAAEAGIEVGIVLGLPIGLGIGCLRAVSDYLLQLLGMRAVPTRDYNERQPVFR